MTNIKERILYIAEYQKEKKEDFFKDLGLSYANFKGIQKKSALNSDAIDKILSKYPSIDANWLITGKGDMLKEKYPEQKSEALIIPGNRKTKDAILEIQEVPFYDGLEATMGLQQLFDSGKPQRILETIKIPNLPKCDGGITVTGDSMYPLLKSGDIVLYKETNVGNIFFGEMYLLSVKIDDWEEYVTVKYVQRSEKGEDYVKLVSQNQHHQPRDIKINQIAAIAMVKASVRFNTMF